MLVGRKESLLLIHPLRRRAKYQTEKVRGFVCCRHRLTLQIGVYARSMVMMVQLAPVR